MSSSGWVWLVADQRGELAVAPTYGPGTLLARGRIQMGSQNQLRNETLSRPLVVPGALHTVGQNLIPLLCISVHEHAWITDYGVWGKEEYLKRFWGAVNWEKVHILFSKVLVRL